jgi:two-component system chemotaxis sensor kinase CheA
MSNELAQDDGLIQEFVTESDEQLHGMEKDLLGLEQAHDAETINRLFRAMHTVKGTSSFLEGPASQRRSVTSR